ncbi:hypothetical protein [Actinokineospora cianjurensis]|uniref:Uncharacterized protein n=1 Tax=Actinokineospora cianjurensis TaxID=585224 RepID=A0A421AWG2_9PSEU|nr:hypothetical protein [Actinokineospora cianjurensis]RLK53877.1 hypothetical protein CLV68_6255 [Actinokineospora cianjurensis]
MATSVPTRGVENPLSLRRFTIATVLGAALTVTPLVAGSATAAPAAPSQSTAVRTITISGSGEYAGIGHGSGTTSTGEVAYEIFDHTHTG